MKRIKLLTLSCLMSLSLPSFAQFSPDHKVSLDKGDIKSFIGIRKVKVKERYTKVMNSPPSVCRLVVFVPGNCMSVEMVHWPIGGLQTMPIYWLRH